MGKMIKTPFNEIVKRATELLEIIHTDVCGPMSTTARNGYLYFVTFTDDLSRYGYIYLMKQKSETFERFKEFQNKVENHQNKRIKFLQSDRGGEYCDTLVFATFSFSRFSRFCPLVWFRSTSIGLELEHISFYAQVALDPDPCQDHSPLPPQPLPPKYPSQIFLFLLKGIFKLFEVCEATHIY